MELLNTLISGISVGSTLCGAIATITGTNTVRAAAIGLKALSDAAEISRDAREHDSDRR